MNSLKIDELRRRWADCREENARLRAALEEAVVEYVPGSDPILDDWLPKARAALETHEDVRRAHEILARESDNNEEG